MPAATTALDGRKPACRPAGRAARRAGAVPAAALGRLELGAEFVQLQFEQPALVLFQFAAAAGLGLDGRPSVDRRDDPQHRLAFGGALHVVARRLRLDRPVGVERIALQRKLSVMLNRRLPRATRFDRMP